MVWRHLEVIAGDSFFFIVDFGLAVKLSFYPLIKHWLNGVVLP